jgi:outer membrane lipoprotein carrier protein
MVAGSLLDGPLTAALFSGLLLAAPARDPAVVVKALEEAGRALKSLQAAFVETRVIVLLDDRQESRGSVTMQIPGRLRWNYETPRPSVMLVKDGRFTRYIPASKQVFRGAAKGDADLLVGFGPGAAGLGKRYEVTLVGDEVVGGRATRVLDLKPKDGQSSLFSGIRLWVDDERGMPVQTRLTEPTDDYTTIRFDKVRINEPVPARTFDLDVPGDVVELK